MKRKNLKLSILAISAMFVLGSCATVRPSYPDDVYGENAQAVVVQEPEPDSYYDADSEEDYYADSEYARRFDRFYYYRPGMTYYDPFFSPWDRFYYYGYGYPASWGWGMGFGWGSPYYYSPYYYNPFYYDSWGWGNPYRYWGPYSYYGYYPGGYYYGNTKTIRRRPGNTATDNITGRRPSGSRGSITSSRTRNGEAIRRPAGIRRPTGVRPGRPEARPSVNRTRPTRENARPASRRPSQSRPTQSRPRTESPRPTRSEQARPAPRQSRPSVSRPSSGGSSRSSGSRPSSSRPRR